MEFPPLFHVENKVEWKVEKMKPERYFEIEESIPKELKLKLLAQITSGLLASGHFTCEDDESGGEYHFQLKIRCYDVGDGKVRKDSTVVAVAERLLDEIVESVYAAEIYNEQEASSDDPGSP
jgi:hypothetical protein